METVLITGANRGIGLGLAQHYLKIGCAVVATARAPEITEVFKTLEVEYGDRFIPVALEVTLEESIDEMVEALKERDVQLDLVINNAGISVEERFGEWTADHFDNHFHVNAAGPALVAQAVVPFMKAGSKLINVSSGMGSLDLNINPENGLDAYAMSKAALNMLTVRLAMKLKSNGVIVATINPGWVQTEMGGPEAPMSIDEAVRALVATIDLLKLEQTGGFYEYNGDELPW